ncbi:MAG: M23/M56 family metallopeptidase [Oscillospiraceae bacterium]|nr:M23/M56 family metallopeptidase [Oscillospiraceae bacterium]
MKNLILILLIMAVCGWMALLAALPFQRKSIPARIRLTALMMPLLTLLVPLPLFCRQTVQLQQAAIRQPLSLSAHPSLEQTSPLPRPGVVPAPSPTLPDGIAEELLTVLWAIGLTACLLAQLSEALTLNRLLRERRPVSGETESLYRTLCASAGLRRNPRLAVCPAVDTPLLTGILKPVILLPDQALTDEELSMVLRHELTHYRKGHLLMQALTRLAAAIHWFHPLGWLLLKKLPSACEAACDEALAATLSKQERKQYGLVILRFSDARAYSGCAALASPRQDMERRLNSVMHPIHISKKVKLFTLLAAAALLCASCGLSYKTAPVAVKQPAAAVSDSSTASDSTSEDESSSAPAESSEAASSAASDESEAPSGQSEPESEVSSEASGFYVKADEMPSETSEAPQLYEKEAPEEEQPAAEQSAGVYYEVLDPEEAIALETDAEAGVWPLPGYTEQSAGYGGRHSGVDLTGDGVEGAEIVAFRDGTVLEAEYDYALGYYVRIDHGSGLVSLYAHCQSLSVQPGDAVTAGQVIAAAGSTGMSTGPHLHFELQQDGAAVNPESYLG